LLKTAFYTTLMTVLEEEQGAFMDTGQNNLIRY